MTHIRGLGIELNDAVEFIGGNFPPLDNFNGPVYNVPNMGTFRIAGGAPMDYVHNGVSAYETIQQEIDR